MLHDFHGKTVRKFYCISRSKVWPLVEVSSSRHLFDSSTFESDLFHCALHHAVWKAEVLRKTENIDAGKMLFEYVMELAQVDWGPMVFAQKGLLISTLCDQLDSRRSKLHYLYPIPAKNNVHQSGSTKIYIILEQKKGCLQIKMQ